MPIILSEEQQLFVDTVLAGHNVLVDACIGSGKTTAIQQLCNVLPTDKRILYLTYNKLLKIDAKSKIHNRNVTVTNYHGFAFQCLIRQGIQAGVSDLIQTFNRIRPEVHYDILIIDEYQDIEQELATLLQIIKDQNPNLQIVMVGDMKQKIYDKTTLNVEQFVEAFLGPHQKLEFTQCFRLSADIASFLGRVWEKNIVGVNDSCQVEYMSPNAVINFIKNQNPEDLICLGARTGMMSTVLNRLESTCPEKFNKNTIYASISDNNAGATEPTATSGIFTTFDSSKGLERKICIVFDYTEDYWLMRLRQPQQAYQILKNIFCVAASRGKERIIFVKEPQKELLSEESLSTPLSQQELFKDVPISGMFDFKYKEDIEECFACLEIEKIIQEDMSDIAICNHDGLIDLSPCIGIYQEARFFNNYDIDKDIELSESIRSNNKVRFQQPQKEKKKRTKDTKDSLEEKILYLVSSDTNQYRYLNQVQTPFVSEDDDEALRQRLSSVFSPNEQVQVRCDISFENRAGRQLFSASGFCDVLKDNKIYELKFVSQLTHEHFLQCACYMTALKKETGILWNVRTNEMYKIRIDKKKKFLNAVTKAVTKGALTEYHGSIKLKPKKTKQPKELQETSAIKSSLFSRFMR